MPRDKLRQAAGIAVLFSGLFPSVGRATIFGADDRVYVTTARGLPFSPVGLVRRGLLIEHYGTGTLIDPCHVLTSQHLFGSNDSAIGGRVKFTAGLGTAGEVSSGGTVVLTGGRESYQSANEQYEAVAHDWMLIRLDKCLGAIFGYASLRTWPDGGIDLSGLKSLGYPVDRERLKGATLDPSCKVRGVYTLVWLNDCATMPGSSGGPLFRLSSSERGTTMEIYAIQTAGFGKGTNTVFWIGNANQATPVWMILPYIQQYFSRMSVTPLPKSQRR
jgi:V8-like Glu-specific endopeptidase